MNKLICKLKLCVRPLLKLIVEACYLSVTVALPISIFGAIRFWSGDNLDFEFDLWESFSLWSEMAVMIIPGSILYLATQD